jgi:transposase
VTTPTNPSTTPHTVDGLLRVVEEKEAEVAFLKLLVDKLKLQLLRGARDRFGASSEQLDDPQIALIEGAPLYERPAPIPAALPDAANAPEIDRKLPAHLPRENQVYRPETTSDPRMRTVRPAAAPPAVDAFA